MARTANKTTAVEAVTTVSPQAIVELGAAPRTLAATQEAMDEVLALGAEIGRLETVEFFRHVGDAVALAIYENIKKSKGWRHLPNQKNSDGRNFESLDEFCRVKLGKSYNRLQELAANRTLIGQEAFEQAERLGLRQRDYSAIKALPAPDQELMRQAVEEAQSRDEVLDLLQELAVRHAQEKAALKKAKDEQEATKNSLKKRDESIIKLEAQKTALERELKAARGQAQDEASGIAKLDVQALAAGAELARLEKDASAVMAQVDAGLRKDFQDLKNACLAAAGEDGDGRDADGFPVALPNHAQLAMQQALAKVIQAAQVLAADYGIVLPRELQAPQAVAWAAQAEAAGGGWRRLARQPAAGARGRERGGGVTMGATPSLQDDALLVQAVPLVQRWLDTPHGQKGPLVQQACAQLGGISVMSFHRLARRVTGERLRKRRDDAGKISLPRQEALLISAYLRQALRGHGKRNASVKQALAVLRDNGHVKAERISPATGEIIRLSDSAVITALRHYGLHPDQLERLTPHTHLVSPHANWCWQMDASVCVVYYLPGGEAMVREMRKEEFYAGKPENWRRIQGQMVIRYLMVEHRWGMLRLHYVHGAESGENACEHLIRAMLRPEDARAMLWGVPAHLMVDPGSAQTGSQFKRLCRRMGINLIINKPGNPRAKGSVEVGHNLVERSFEHGLKLLGRRVCNIDDLNREADVWQRATNANAIHSRYNGRRFERWAEDVRGHLVAPPPERVMRDLATREPVQRTVGDDYSIPWEGGFFYAGNVPDIRIGEKVLVHHNPWRGNELVLIREDENGQDIQFPLAEMVRDGAGQFARHGAVIGQQYRAAPDSDVDANRKEVTRVLAGEATLATAEKKMKRKGTVPLEALGIDPLKRARETPLPDAVPEASGEHALASTPVVMVSKMRAARLIRNGLGRDMTGEEFAWMNQRWPERVPEEQIANLVAQFGRTAQEPPVASIAPTARIAPVAPVAPIARVA